MKIIFAVDDSDVNLVQAKRALASHYRVRTMHSAAMMLKIIDKVKPDLILLDIEMPEMNGFAAIEVLKKNQQTSNIPVMFLTASTDVSIEAKGLELGAVDFITKPFSPPVLLNRIAHHLNIEDLLKKRTKRLKLLQDSILNVVADMLENRDKVTGGHIERTSLYIEVLMDVMAECGIYHQEMEKWDLSTVVSSARLHDVGKVAVPDFVLKKPGKLTDDEYDEIKKHALVGEQIVDKIIEKTGEETFLRHAKLFAGCHHEKWDGSGYPRGLSGVDIPLEGRIMAIADVYDALVSERPYKKPFTHNEAVNIISKDSGRHFDPAIADVFSQVGDVFWFIHSGGASA